MQMSTRIRAIRSWGRTARSRISSPRSNASRRLTVPGLPSFQTIGIQPSVERFIELLIRRARHSFAVDDDALIGMIGESGLLFATAPPDVAIRLQQSSCGGLRHMIGQPARRLCETGCNCPARHTDDIAIDRFGSVEAPVAVAGGHGVAVEQVEAYGVGAEQGDLSRQKQLGRRVRAEAGLDTFLVC